MSLGLFSLKAELERKRKQVEELKKTGKKYIKRAEIEKKQEEEYRKQQEELERKKKRKIEETPKPPVAEPPEEKKEEEQLLPVNYVIKRLRARGEPITLFGETARDRQARLRQLELGSTDEESKAIQGRNEFDMAIKNLEENLEEEAAQAVVIKKTRDPNKKRAWQGYTPLSNDPELLPKEEEDRIYILLKFLFFLWGMDLEQRSEEEKRTRQGKVDTTTFVQTKKYIKPLFQLLKTRNLEPGMRQNLVKVCRHLKERNYVDANHAYLSIAIGNAAWPIGVTMVGIHERSAREKIFTNQVAHVLNDETSRKYLQSLKRIMTYCQRKFPADPSKCVEYEREFFVPSQMPRTG